MIRDTTIIWLNRSLWALVATGVFGVAVCIHYGDWLASAVGVVSTLICIIAALTHPKAIK